MKIQNIFRRFQTGFALGLLAFVTTIGGSIALANHAWAATCDNANIVYCGLDGSTTRNYIASMRSHWQNTNPADFRQIARWGGWNQGLVDGMMIGNTKVGTLNATTGTITVDCRIVARQTHMSARFNGGASFYAIKEGVWARPITANHASNSYKVLVAFDTTGKAVAGVAVDCGNILKFTATEPPAPAPSPKLTCMSLTATPQATARNFKFDATSAAQNTTIQKYTFDFGDGTPVQTVNTNQTTASTTHTYADKTASYTARVYVHSADVVDVTAPTCTKAVSVTATPVVVNHPAIAIEKTASADSVAVNQEFTYTIKVTNTGDVALTNVIVSDKAPANITFVRASSGNVTSVLWTTTLAQLAKGASATFTITAKATAVSDSIVNKACVNANEITGTEDDCDEAELEVGAVKAAECKPGIPVGDEDCAADEGDEDEDEDDPEALPDTGAGSIIGLAIVAAMAGGSLHYLVRNGFPKVRFNRYEN